MSEWTGLVGALLGGAVGFFAVWWQHRAQKLERIRTKCADLIFIGDEYEAGKLLVDIPHHLGRHDPQKVQDARLVEMKAIVRYLELTAGKAVYGAVLDYWRAIENLGWVGQAMSDRKTVERKYLEARTALMKRLKR